MNNKKYKKSSSYTFYFMHKHFKKLDTIDATFDQSILADNLLIMQFSILLYFTRFKILYI